MAIDLNTAEGRAAAVKLLDPDFQGLLEQKKVSERVQATMAVANVRSISLFSVLGEATTDIRTFAADQCGLDRNRDMVEVASLVDTWNACKTRMTVRHQAQAEAHNAQLPPPMNKTEAQDLRARFEQMFYKLEDKVSPATGTLELLSEQVDSGEFRAMSLVQFLSRKDQEEEPLGVTLDKAGSIKVRKGFGESKPPKSGEELRQKVKLLGHCYIFTMLKYPNRQTLAENNPNLWNKYADYLLGEHVMRLAAKNSKGEVVSSPSLSLVLSYEYQVRKLMTRVMNEGKNIAEALEQAMKDTTVKERYFHFLQPFAVNVLNGLKHRLESSEIHLGVPVTWLPIRLHPHDPQLLVQLLPIVLHDDPKWRFLEPPRSKLPEDSLHPITVFALLLHPFQEQPFTDWAQLPPILTSDQSSLRYWPSSWWTQSTSIVNCPVGTFVVAPDGTTISWHRLTGINFPRLIFSFPFSILWTDFQPRLKFFSSSFFHWSCQWRFFSQHFFLSPLRKGRSVDTWCEVQHNGVCNGLVQSGWIDIGTCGSESLIIGPSHQGLRDLTLAVLWEWPCVMHLIIEWWPLIWAPLQDMGWWSQQARRLPPRRTPATLIDGDRANNWANGVHQISNLWNLPDACWTDTQPIFFSNNQSQILRMFPKKKYWKTLPWDWSNTHCNPNLNWEFHQRVSQLQILGVPASNPGKSPEVPLAPQRRWASHVCHSHTCPCWTWRCTNLLVKHDPGFVVAMNPESNHWMNPF